METLTLNADSGRLLDLVVHALYTRPEVFLRELVANASDALDRYRLEAMVRPELVDSAPLEITLSVDVSGRTLTIADNGIGMNRDEVVAHIGTIARSGTREFQERWRTDSPGAADLIGRFGVGFYSCFMVAERVTLTTRRGGEAGGTRLDSAGDVHYTLSDAPEAPRGTSITLHLKPVDDDAGIQDYTNRWVLAGIIRSHADFVTYPIVYVGPALELHDPAPSTSANGDAIRVVLNSMRPIWTKPESEVTAEESAEFYRHITQDVEDPLVRVFAKAEGRWEYRALLFAPAQAPYDLYYHSYTYGLQLYSHRMLIAQSCHELLPRYLRFIRGVVDAADLPLNVSRQSLQQAHHLSQVRRWVTRKILDALERLRIGDPARYLTLWQQFGRAIKEGVAEDYENRERLLPLLLFESSAHPSDRTSLADYVVRMKSGQTDIYYLAGESRAMVERSPHLELLQAKGFEVLYFTEPVDELVAQTLHEFDGRRLRSAAKGDLALASDDPPTGDGSAHEPDEAYAPLLTFMSGHLQNRVRDVQISKRLTSSAACLIGTEFDLSPHIEKLLHANAPRRRTLEINPRHRIVGALRRRVAADPSDPLAALATDLLYGTALLAEGTQLPDRAQFVSSVNDLLSGALAATQAPAAEISTADLTTA